MKTLFVTTGTFLLVSSSTFAATWTVDDDGPADFNTIQAAVDASVDGDEIVVMPGVYTNTNTKTTNNVVEILGKNLTLKSFSSADDTFIDGEGNSRGINCDNSCTVVVEGFTIINGGAFGSGAGGGASYIHPGSSATFILCNFKDCIAHSGGAIFSAGTAIVEVLGCSFKGNISTYSSAGNAWEHYSSGGTCTIDTSVILQNQFVWQNGTAITISNSLLCNIVTGDDVGGNTYHAGTCDQSLTTDCNNNGVPDTIELVSGTTADTNGNGIPDECECLVDMNTDGVVNIADLLALMAFWGPAGSAGDFNEDGEVGIADLLILIAAWGNCQ